VERGAGRERERDKDHREPTERHCEGRREYNEAMIVKRHESRYGESICGVKGSSAAYLDVVVGRNEERQRRVAVEARDGLNETH